MFPTLYESTYISIQTLWLFVVFGLLISSYLAVKRLKRRRVNFTLFIEHSGSFVLSALIVSRVLYFITNTNQYFPALDLRTIWNFISIWDQGFSFWGAVLGFVLMLSYRIYKAKENTWKWFDALTVPFLVGIAIGNIGTFLGGYAYGTPSSLPWAVQYESFIVKYTVPIHPTQIYLILFIVLILWSKYYLKKKTDFFETDGNATLYISTLFSFGYFLLEFIRGDDTLYILDIRISMLLSLILFVICGFYLLKRFLVHKKQS